MKITEYQSKGKTLYQWSGYVGTDTVGQLITKRRGFISKREAELSYYKFVDEFNQGMHHRKDPNAIITINDLYKYWLPTYRNTVAESTLQKTLTTLDNHILTPYGDLPLDELTHTKLQNIIHDLHARLKNYKRGLHYLNQMLQLAVVNGFIDANPFQRIIWPKANKPKTSPDKALTADQFATFWHYVKKTFEQSNPRAFTFMRLLAFTGMRRGEALALAWADINFHTNTLRIGKSLAMGLDNRLYISQSAKTEAGNRTILLDPETFVVVSRLRDLVKPESDDELIFSTQKGVLPSLNTPQKWMNKIILTANGSLPHITPHMLRHTYTTLMLKNGAQIAQVQTLLGHADPTITMSVYNHLKDTELIKDAPALYDQTVNKWV